MTVAGLETSLFYDIGWGFIDFNFNYFTEQFEATTQASIQQPQYSGALTLGTRWFDERLLLGGRLTFFDELDLNDVGFSREDSFFWEANEIVDVFGSYKLNDNLSLGFSIENVADTFYMPPLLVSWLPATGRTVRVNTTVQF